MLRWIALLGFVSLVFAQDAIPPAPEGYEAEPGGSPEENLWQVLVLFGVTEGSPDSWTGRVAATGGATIHAIQPYRFELPDKILPEGGFRVDLKSARILFGSAPEGKRPRQMRLPKGIYLRGVGPSGNVSVETQNGTCAFSPARLSFASSQPCADGIIVRRTLPATDLSGAESREHDFPAIGASPNGTLWTTWLSYHDRLEELNLRRYKNGRWTRLIPVPRASADLWRPHVAADETGRPWLIWSQQTAGNWDLYAMPWDGNSWGAIERLTQNPLPDIEPHVARAPDGTIYVVWQALEGSVSHIRLRYRREGKWSQPVAVTAGAENDWRPAVAAGPDGRVWIAWDRYGSPGDSPAQRSSGGESLPASSAPRSVPASYDIWARSFTPNGAFGEERKIAGSARMETSASVAVDSANRPWIAWETGGEQWGKDLGPLAPRSVGSALGDSRRVEVAVFDSGEWKSTPAFSPADVLDAGAASHSAPMLFADPTGSVWMTFKRRYSRQASSPTTHWETFLTRAEGDGWMEPMPLPASLSRKSTSMGISAANGRLWLFWPTDSRRYEFTSRPRANRVIAGSMPLPSAPAEAPRLSALRLAPDSAAAPAHADEPADLRAIRAHRVRLGRDSLRIVRGDLHRHTELSPDQGGLSDGSLPEFYRYMIDAAGMDFGASTDHQAGGADYWNFMTWKMADMFHFPQRFVPLYAYERNVSWPHGHRNIIHTSRDYAIVPFFQSINSKFLLPDSPDGELLTFNSNSFGGVIENDTKLLYEELRKSGGIAIPHTSGSNSMGTDWRDNDRDLEPVLEIYQGDRHNYETKNAPRAVKDGEERRAIGGFAQAGMVWNAWKKGYRLGVIASSDHFSTHISYAMIYTPQQARQPIFDSIRKRHAYGATDNIVLEFWFGGAFMGDDVRASRREKIRVKARGTAPVAAVHLIRDGAYVYKTEPGASDVDIEYLDREAGPGEHWYYVRVEQANGELAWSSPIWVNYGAGVR
ncbi:MAG: hypothetical protein R2729_12775 [Bryobacteraceae bacterium]